MEVNIEAVRTVFRDVLDGRMTREAADRWAYALVKQSESGGLSFVPAADKDRIWSGLMYLYGIDSLQAPGKYLHDEEEILAAMKSKVGRE